MAGSSFTAEKAKELIHAVEKRNRKKNAKAFVKLSRVK